MKKIIFIFLILSPIMIWAQESQKLILITLDGLRWEELFRGAHDSLMTNANFVKDSTVLLAQFQDDDMIKAREKLMPWFWGTLAKEGQLYGNREYGNQVDLTNFFWFSYPGYNEILSGFSDPEIDSNAKEWNRNKTVLEHLNEKEEFQGQIAAFCSWDVFPYIINTKRSNIPVNAGFENAPGFSLSDREVFLNEIQASVPSPWATVRLDFFTHHYALEYMKRKHPKVVYLAYGETDDFAHDGRYDHYLKSARQTDKWIGELWEYLQSDPFYAGSTSLLITTDHGRGHSPAGEWKSHGKTYEGSNSIWIAAIGPGIKALGEVKEPMQLWQNQVAKTAAALLGFDYENDREEVGKVIESILKK